MQQADLKTRQTPPPQNRPEDYGALTSFYRSLIDVITVLSIACASEVQNAPVYTESRRRPILVLWKGVLADLCLLQCVFKNAYAKNVGLVGKMPRDIVEPSVVAQRHNEARSAYPQTCLWLCCHVA